MSGENERRVFGVRETSWPTTGDKCAGWETSFLALYFDSKVGDKLAGLRDKLVFGRQVGQPETSWPGVPETSSPTHHFVCPLAFDFLQRKKLKKNSSVRFGFRTYGSKRVEFEGEMDDF